MTIFTKSQIKGLETKIKKYEDCVLVPYPDRDGWSVGYGHWLGKVKPDIENISPQQAEEFFQADFAIAINDYDKVFCEIYRMNDKINIARKFAFIDMLFTLGLSQFLDFDDMLRAVEVEDWKEVALEVFNSKYFWQVGKERIKENMKRLWRG